MTRDERCLVCGSGFTEEEWTCATRHRPTSWPRSTRMLPDCSDDVTNEEWDVATREPDDHARL